MSNRCRGGRDIYLSIYLYIYICVWEGRCTALPARIDPGPRYIYYYIHRPIYIFIATLSAEGAPTGIGLSIDRYVCPLYVYLPLPVLRAPARPRPPATRPGDPYPAGQGPSVNWSTPPTPPVPPPARTSRPTPRWPTGQPPPAAPLGGSGRPAPTPAVPGGTVARRGPITPRGPRRACRTRAPRRPRWRSALAGVPRARWGRPCSPLHVPSGPIWDVKSCA